MREGRMEEYTKGNELFRSGHIEDAQAVYENALLQSTDDPLTIKLLLNTAQCHLILRNYDEVIDKCTSVLCIDDSSVKALIRRAIAEEYTGDFNRSLADISLAMKLNTERRWDTEIRRIYTRVKAALSEDEKAQAEQICPSSFVTPAQTLRMNFGATVPSTMIVGKTYIFRVNISNEFGLWNYASMWGKPDGDNPTVVNCEVIKLFGSAVNIYTASLQDSIIGKHGRALMRLKISKDRSQDEGSTYIDEWVMLRFFATGRLSGVVPVFSLPVQLVPDASVVDENLCDRNETPMHQIHQLLGIARNLSAQCIRSVTLPSHDDPSIPLSNSIYVLECPGSLGIGGKVWDSSFVLLKYLATTSLLRGRPVIELGSGTGITGLAASFLSPSSVLLTDIDEVTPLLVANILLNKVLYNSLYDAHCSDVFSICGAKTYMWGSPAELPNTSNPYVVIASDVVYDPRGYESLATSLKELLTSPCIQRNQQPYADLVVLAHRHRNPSDSNFFELISSSESGLDIREIEPHTWMKERSKLGALSDVKIFHIARSSMLSL